MTQRDDYDENGITPVDDEPGPYNPRRFLGGRPLSMYGVAFAGVAVLVALLAVVIIQGRGDEPPPITCLPLSPDEGEALVNDGQVQRINVLTESGKPETGPIAVTLDLNNGSCRELPKGVAQQRDLYVAIGVVTVRNQTQPSDNRIRIVWEEQANIPPPLLATITPTPLPTLTPTSTPIPTPTLVPTATPLPTATPIPSTATPLPTATPPPTPTPVPPTSTPPPPTATPAPTATASTAPPTATAQPTRSARPATASTR
jgi:hypothetical protein